MCIYLGDDPSLTYKKQEHVFPAGLGGIAKLPYGVVSDKANEEFSKLEDKLMHQSLVSIDRMFFGPGIRGSHNPKKASKSSVCVSKSSDGNIPILCYISQGTPYTIPYIFVDRNQIRLSFPNNGESLQKRQDEFKTALQNFNGRFVHLKSNFVPQNSILIGCFENKYYVATTTERPSTESIKDIISLFLNPPASSLTKRYEKSEQVTTDTQVFESPEIARMYAKVAMNTLAHLKGEPYVKSNRFDEIRKWIIAGENEDEFYTLPDNSINPFIDLFPKMSHWCLFQQINGHIVAVVCFYGHCIYKFILGAAGDSSEFKYPCGFVCDWQNQKEYTTNQYIEALAIVKPT